MAESHTLTTPITYSTPAPLIEYKIIRFFIDRSGAESRLLVAVRSNTGTVIETTYVGAVADSLISALNTANLTIKSLQKRILERMVIDGFLPAGTVTGTPD